MKIGSNDLQFTLSNGGFSDNLAAKIVRGLMTNIVSVVTPAPSSASSSFYSSMFGGNQHPVEGILITKLQNKLKLRNSSLSPSSSSLLSAANASIGNYLSGTFFILL